MGRGWGPREGRRGQQVLAVLVADLFYRADDWRGRRRSQRSPGETAGAAGTAAAGRGCAQHQEQRTEEEETALADAPPGICCAGLRDGHLVTAEPLAHKQARKGSCWSARRHCCVIACNRGCVCACLRCLRET